MGDPKKLKKKYNTPMHPWNREAIDTEKILVKEYGLAKKKEIFIASSFLKKYKDIAKHLIASKTPQALKEKEQMMKKLQNLGLLSTNAELDNILSLELKDILERRIQSVLYRKGLARSMKQARQFITHNHVALGDKYVNSPSYLISLSEEAQLKFKERSPLSDAEHPERTIIVKEAIVEVKPETKVEKVTIPKKVAKDQLEEDIVEIVDPELDKEIVLDNLEEAEE